MKILSLSTSTNICSVAILEDNLCLKEIHTNDNKTHSVNLMPIVSQILQEMNLTLKNIDLIACDIGPGSFTGIRIGVSTAKALAVVNDIPVVGVSSLEALACNIQKDNGTICSLIDARNHQAYCGLFDTKYSKICEYLADDIDTVLKTVNTYSNVTFIGDGAKNYLNENCETEFYATQIGILGYNKYKNGIQQNADTITPLYLRVSQAERMKIENASNK